jgi:hypothetical protein
VREFALLFDDVPYELSDPADAARFGTGPAGLGSAHGEAVRRFVADVLVPRGITGPVIVCPTDYAGSEPSPYRDAFAEAAPAEVVVTWTGRGVVVGTVTRADIDAAAASYRRPLLLWDNFPVNDYEPSRLFLGPLTGRAGDVAGSALVGIMANPMIEAAPSRIPLRTVADWAGDPAGYRPEPSLSAALAAEQATDLAPLVRVCSAWPPSADQDPELTAATQAALTGECAALDVVEARLAELAECCATAFAPAELLTALRPWLDGAAATAAAGLAAVELLRAGHPEGDLVAATRAALAQAEKHYPNVLRPIVPPFVRAVLERMDPLPDDAGRPVAVLLSGGAADAGGAAARALFEAAGFTVRSDGPLDAAAFVVVTGAAPAAELGSLAALPVPVLAWGGLVELGLAERADSAMLWHGVEIVAPEDPLAAGLAGAVPLYRGPGYVRVADVGAGARVIARGPDHEARPVLFRYSAGDVLVDGTPAPAPRIGLFCTGYGPADWLLDDTGRALFAAALKVAVGG